MSELPVKAFLKQHKQAEVVAGVGVVAVGVIAFATDAYGKRKKRQHELQTLSGENLEERAKLLDFANEAEALPSLTTIIAGKLVRATLEGGNDGLPLAHIYATAEGDQDAAERAVATLTGVRLIEHGQLLDGTLGVKATNDLNQISRDGLSVALASYLYNQDAL